MPGLCSHPWWQPAHSMPFPGPGVPDRRLWRLGVPNASDHGPARPSQLRQPRPERGPKGQNDVGSPAQWAIAKVPSGLPVYCSISNCHMSLPLLGSRACAPAPGLPLSIARALLPSPFACLTGTLRYTSQQAELTTKKSAHPLPAAERQAREQAEGCVRSALRMQQRHRCPFLIGTGLRLTKLVSCPLPPQASLSFLRKQAAYKMYSQGL